jgi:hypothetical protein
LAKSPAGSTAGYSADTAPTAGTSVPHDGCSDSEAMYAALMARLPPAESPVSDSRAGSPPKRPALSATHVIAQPI